MTIPIIDAGHGKDTPGKRSPEGLCTTPGHTALFEFEFNRDIAHRVMNALREKKIPFEELVPEIEDISLSERARRANKLIEEKPEDDYFLVSIHANAGKGTGWEIFHYPGSAEGKKIANIFNEIAKEKLPQFRNRGVKAANFAMLRKPFCTSVLTENLFMDTEQDLAFLITDEGRQVIADLHTEAIIRYMEE